MPYRVKVDRSVNCVFVQHFDTFVLEEGTTQAKETILDPEYLPGMNYLRDVTQTVLPPEYCLNWFKKHAVDVLPQVEKGLGTSRKVAWVLSNANDFKTIHQWAATIRLNMYVSERRPFRSVDNARAWLEIPEEYEVSYPE